MKTEEQIRQDGFEWNCVEAAFCWYDLSKDFMRELIQYDPTYKTQLEHALIMDMNRYSIHASVFYRNMYQYIKNGLAETKELENFADKVYFMYREQAEKEYSSRQIYRIVDGTGRVLDSWVI